MIVVDASVIVKCYLPEIGSEEALAILTGREQLIAPALLRLEVHSAIVRHYRESSITEEEAERHGNAFENHLHARKHLQLFPDDEYVLLARKIALELRHPVQDCLYLALASEQDALLVTADAKFHLKAKKIHRGVELLKGMSKV